jgi:hypothetical protein
MNLPSALEVLALAGRIGDRMSSPAFLRAELPKTFPQPLRSKIKLLDRSGRMNSYQRNVDISTQHLMRAIRLFIAEEERAPGMTSVAQGSGIIEKSQKMPVTYPGF